MYGYLSGKITYKSPTYVYVDVQGVGYHVNISLNTYSKLEDKSEVKLYTTLQVKEDDLSLYGFITDLERQLFNLLISVSGVGANTARVILSYMNEEDLMRIIANGDAVSISKVKGIGPKTAQKIVIDLREKVIKLSGSEKVDTTMSSGNNLREDALSAMLALGFAKANVEKTINQVLQKQPQVSQVEDLIKEVLKQMN
jgi:holliday junction DNA helicase RuvA